MPTQGYDLTTQITGIDKFSSELENCRNAVEALGNEASPRTEAKFRRFSESAVAGLRRISEQAVRTGKAIRNAMEGLSTGTREEGILSSLPKGMQKTIREAGNLVKTLLMVFGVIEAINKLAGAAGIAIAAPEAAAILAVAGALWLVNKRWEGIKAGLAEFPKMIKECVNDPQGFAARNWDLNFRWMLAVIDDFLTLFGVRSGFLLDIYDSILGRIKSLFLDFASWVVEKWKEVIMPAIIDMWDGIHEKCDEIITKLKPLWNDFASWVVEKWGEVVMPAIIDMWDGIHDKWDATIAKMKSLWSDFVNWIVEKWNLVIPSVSGWIHEKVQLLKTGISATGMPSAPAPVGTLPGGASLTDSGLNILQMQSETAARQECISTLRQENISRQQNLSTADSDLSLFGDSLKREKISMMDLADSMKPVSSTTGPRLAKEMAALADRTHQQCLAAASVSEAGNIIAANALNVGGGFVALGNAIDPALKAQQEANISMNKLSDSALGAAAGLDGLAASSQEAAEKAGKAQPRYSLMLPLGYPTDLQDPAQVAAWNESIRRTTAYPGWYLPMPQPTASIVNSLGSARSAPGQNSTVIVNINGGAIIDPQNVREAAAILGEEMQRQAKLQY